MKFNFDWYKTGIAAQGDVAFQVIDKLPDDAVLVEPEGDNHVIAHSETGHNHVIPANDIDFFKAANADQFGFYLVALADTFITHLRSFDTHKPIAFKKDSVIRVRRQRAYENGAYKAATD